MSDSDVYRLHPPSRKEGTYLIATDPLLKVPQGYGRIPGYRERLADVRCGRVEPFWGTEYALLNGKLTPDFANADAQQVAASESLKCLLTKARVDGVHYFPINVDGQKPMYILGVEGRADIRPVPMDFVLLEGAEAGLYRGGGLLVSSRVAGLIRQAELVMDVIKAEVSFSDLNYLPLDK